MYKQCDQTQEVRVFNGVYQKSRYFSSKGNGLCPIPTFSQDLECSQNDFAGLLTFLHCTVYYGFSKPSSFDSIVGQKVTRLTRGHSSIHEEELVASIHTMPLFSVG
jgi:hypothetical protein